MANAGIAPPDFSTDVGRVRLLTSDTDASNISAGSGEYLWSSDAEITALIDLTGTPERAAIRILRLVAMTPAMQLKKWSSADLSVDGAAITNALRALIKDIENGMGVADASALSEVAMIVPTGAAVAQPALYPGAEGVDFDPTLPYGLV